MFLKRSANIWFPILVLLGLIGLTVFNLNLQAEYTGIDSFAPRWTAARMWLQRGLLPYDEQVYAETLTIMQDYDLKPDLFDQGHVIEPAFYVYLYLPLSMISFPLARAIWMTIVILAYLGSALVAMDLAGARFGAAERIGLALLSLLIYPAWKLILQASIVPVFIFLLLLAVSLAFKDKSGAASVLLFICAGILPISIPIAIFLAIWRMQQRDSGFWSLYLAGIAFLVLSALILFPGWPGAWFANFIQLYPSLNWIHTPLMCIADILPRGSQIVAIGLHALLILIVLVEWYGIFRWDRRMAAWKLSLSLNLLYFLNLRSHGAYILLVLPGLYMTHRFLYEKWRLTGRITAWMIYLALIWAYWKRSALISPSNGYEPSLIILLLPFITFTGLQWFRHWATVSPVARVETRN